MDDIQIRKAKLSDIQGMYQLIFQNAQKNLMLPRALSELYEHLRDYAVAVQGHRVIGVSGLGICWEDLGEIKSLAVETSFMGRGIGTKLVNFCLGEAREIGLKRVFALTYIPLFFQKLGFQEIPKEELPHKIWSDCVKCPKFPKCDEIAVVFHIKEGETCDV